MPVLKTLASFLPAPEYLLMPAIGIDISDTSLKYIELKKDKKSGQTLELTNWGDIDIPEGTLSRGHVIDVDKLAESLRQVRTITGQSFARLSLPEERAYIFETEIKKNVPFKEIRGLLEFKLEENVPLSPKDAYFEYELFPVPESKQDVLVSVTVYAKETIMQYYEACGKAGLTPLAFEVEAQGIARASIPRELQKNNTHLIIDFGKTRTGIGVVHAGVLMYTSTIDIGGSALSDVMRTHLGNDIKESELTTIKNNEGLLAVKEDSPLQPAMLSTMSAIKDEIATRIEYWNTRQTQGRDRYIEQVILCGGSSNLRGLPEYLTSTLDIPTKRANVWQNVFDIANYVPPITKRYSYGYATAIGLAVTPYL